MERNVPFPEAVVYSFIHISQEFPVREFSHPMGEQHTVADHGAPRGRRPTYNGVQPGSPKESFTALLLLPQCHAACSMIPSTLAWVDLWEAIKCRVCLLCSVREVQRRMHSVS